MEGPPFFEMNFWFRWPPTGRMAVMLLVLLAVIELKALLARPSRKTKPREISSMFAIGACTVTWALSLWEGALGSLLPAWTGIIGVLAFAGGIALRAAAFLQLGRFYDPAITIHADHRLVQTGLYRFMRHPLYAGSILLFSGFSLAFSSLAGLAAFFVFVMPVFAWRVHIEERELRNHFGRVWDEYAQTTRRWGFF